MWITRVSIANPVFAAMVMVALCVLGLFSYAKLGVEQMPDISFPGAWMEVRYPGATPEALEREVLKPLEEAVNDEGSPADVTDQELQDAALDARRQLLQKRKKCIPACAAYLDHAPECPCRMQSVHSRSSFL